MKRFILVICMLLTGVLCKPQNPAQGNLKDIKSDIIISEDKPKPQPQPSLPTDPLPTSPIISSALSEPNVIQQGCGYQNNDTLGLKITSDNYNQSRYGESPWMVAILRHITGEDGTFNIYQCGGSLIHPSVVLTAAHCVYKRPVNILKIRAGKWDIRKKEEFYPDQDRNVVDVITHHENTSDLINDIALLFLDKPVELADNIKIICLPPKDTNFDGARCFTSGRGKDIYGEDSKYQNILKIDLPIISNDECQTTLRKELSKYFELDRSFLCAGGEKGQDTCEGKDGSPLVCPIPGFKDRFYQAGIVFWRLRCEDGFPDVFTKVLSSRTWIEEQLKNKKLDTAFFTP